MCHAHMLRSTIPHPSLLEVIGPALDASYLHAALNCYHCFYTFGNLTVELGQTIPAYLFTWYVYSLPKILFQD